jgi:hypothetical protein
MFASTVLIAAISGVVFILLLLSIVLLMWKRSTKEETDSLGAEMTADSGAEGDDDGYYTGCSLTEENDNDFQRHWFENNFSASDGLNSAELFASREEEAFFAFWNQKKESKMFKRR